MEVKFKVVEQGESDIETCQAREIVSLAYLQHALIA